MLRAFAAVAILLASASAPAQWLQWGGAGRNFTCDGKGLAPKWPDGGPRKLWSAKVGDGYSAILVDGDRLYTMCRKPEEKKEAVLCLSAKDGSTIWQFDYEALLTADMGMEFGPGPHSTPLIVGERIFSIGVTCKLHALDKKTGKPVWSHDLKEEFGAEQLGRGYSASPIAYGDTIIVEVGGRPGQSLMAFNQADGKLVWGDGEFDISHASPILIKLGGQDQLIMFAAQEVLGINPATGEQLWSHPFKTQFGANISTPVFGDDGILFCSAAYRSGARALQLEHKDGKTTVKELWDNNKVQIHHGNAVRIGDFVYCGTGDFAANMLQCVNVKTGEAAWKERSFPKANVIAAGDKLVLLDQDGNLALLEASPKEMKVLGQVEMLKRVAWTVPTLVGTTLYVRDRANLIALDLGA